MKCIFCGTKKFIVIAPALRDSGRHKVVKCADCGLAQISPIPAPDSEKKFYDQGRQAGNIGSRTDIVHLYKEQRADTLRRADFVSRLLKPGASILDVGSGYGFFLKEMTRRKFKARGLEISKAARNIAKKITEAEILDLDLLSQEYDGKFEAVTAFHVLEHVASPVAMLKKLARLLKKRGRLIIEVPNLNDWMLSEPAYRKFYWQRAHLSYFNQTAISKILRKAGLKTFKFHFLQRYSLLNAVNWILNNRPQIDSPSFSSPRELAWMENYYKSTLTKNKTSDTLLIVVSK